MRAKQNNIFGHNISFIEAPMYNRDDVIWKQLENNARLKVMLLSDNYLEILDMLGVDSLVCPECVQKKHVNCCEEALDSVTDEFGPCMCPCQQKKESS